MASRSWPGFVFAMPRILFLPCPKQTTFIPGTRSLLGLEAAFGGASPIQIWRTLLRRASGYAERRAALEDLVDRAKGRADIGTPSGHGDREIRLAFARGCRGPVLVTVRLGGERPKYRAARAIRRQCDVVSIQRRAVRGSSTLVRTST